ncbi:hypothetical protein NELLIE_50 [Arthrobacter phage Nellie]|uniref:Uncharacterized protein n=4 Tax=Jasminevirus adat TaxID=2560299 RepID=A0A249XN89_9CAUD|nr:hypothetical protein FDI47_gp50 [Arthrobacter phage Adat]ASZ72621.1 hypothetical protein ADAT_50 [Arthrobacter phage Adat]ASZ73203.1 hypothetical protein GURGLEFERB_50 [Arthrobacter phage GurgleFerb]ASZ73768.1 hypothetical protein NELLIE_50 [Arthrobacter phage Nellie]AXH43738.1 hypothetical protein SEA_BRAD_50 [Arthrobacter phage Brad]
MTNYLILQNTQFRTEDDPEWKHWEYMGGGNKAMLRLGMHDWTTGIRFHTIEDAAESMDRTIERSFLNTQTDLMYEIPGRDPITNAESSDHFRTLVCTHKLVAGTYFLITFFIFHVGSDTAVQWRTS